MKGGLAGGTIGVSSRSEHEETVRMLHAGLDLGRRRLDVCLLNEAGELIAQTAGPVGDSWRREGEARPGAGALDRDERRDGAVALGLRTDPVQAPGIPGLARSMNVLLKAREVGFYLQDSGANVLFAWSGFAEDAQAGAAATGAECVLIVPAGFVALVGEAEPSTEVVEPAGDDTAVILYTSGTTGTPKGAELTHASLTSNVEVSGELFSVSSTDVIFGGLPLFHVFGLTCGLNTAIAAGATLTLLPRFDPTKALEILERDRVTIFEGVPTMYGALLNHPRRAEYDVAALRVCVSGGAALPVEVLRGFDAAFGCKILEGYGLSETSPVASFNHPDCERKPGSIGTPVRGVEMKVFDDDNEAPQGEVGEIVIRGHNLMKGYWRKPEATEAAIRDGWFHTGDVARVDEDGYFFIIDRMKDMIIRGGYNV
jgi:long-chain acyl-CoA synthetase